MGCCAASQVSGHGSVKAPASNGNVASSEAGPRQDQLGEPATAATPTGAAEVCTFQESEGWQLHPDGSVAEHVPQAKFHQLVSFQCASTGILEWTLFLDGAADCWLVGVVPTDIVEKKGDYLLQQCKAGVKGTGAGGCKKEQFTLNKQFLRVICNLDRNDVAFFVGDTLSNLTQRSQQSIKKTGVLKRSISSLSQRSRERMKRMASMKLAVGITPSQAGQVRLVSATGGKGYAGSENRM